MELIRSNKRLFYLLFLISESALFAVGAHLRNGTISIWSYFIVSIIIFFILSLPFVILNNYSKGAKNRFLAKSIVDGVLIWVYVSLLPLTLVAISKSYLNTLVFGAAEILIGLYFIFKFKLPKGLAILALFFSVIANLYFLIYGLVKSAKRK